MIRGFCSIIALFFISSCSFPSASHHYLEYWEVAHTTKIYNIIIKRWEKQKYSGLLAIKIERNGIHYVLLDPTGIKLLESDIGGGETNLVPITLGPLAGSSLNKFLDSALLRLLVEKPDEHPCSWNGLAQFCYFMAHENRWTKVYKIWPVTYWRAEQKNDTNDHQSFYVYSQPWIGMGVELREVK